MTTTTNAVNSPAALLQARGLSKHYRAPRTALLRATQPSVALDSVNLDIARGASVAIVGESGSGKSTLLRLLLGLSRSTSGEVRFDGRLVEPRRDRMLWLRTRTGIVFQDPYSSLNPRRTVAQTIAEPLVAIRAEGDHHARVLAMLDRLELPIGSADRYPHSFSGGQRQRIAIARALVHEPELLLADEPVSALDVLVRGRIIRQLSQLRQEMGLTMVTVTHDLGVVPHLAEHVVVLHQGRIVEQGPTAKVLSDPANDYTKMLVRSLPRLPSFDEPSH